MGITWRRSRGLLVCLALLCVGGHRVNANAEVAPVTERIGSTTVNWSDGVIGGWVVGVAERRAPSPASARAAARRRGLEQAVTRLQRAAAQLPWAGKKPAVDDAFWATHAKVFAEELLPDGSWRLNVGIPIEALRQLREGPRAASGDRAKSMAVVVDATSLRLTPRVGVSILAGKKKLVPAMVWVRAGANAAENFEQRIEVRAERLRQDTIELSSPLDAAEVASALFIIVLAKTSVPRAGEP